MSKTKKLALASILSSLAVVIILLGNSIDFLRPYAWWIAGGVIYIIKKETGNKFGGLALFTTWFLSQMLLPRPNFGVTFLLVYGLYPLFKDRIDTFSTKAIRTILKLLYFSVANVITISFSVFITGLPFFREGVTSPWLQGVTLFGILFSGFYFDWFVCKYGLEFYQKRIRRSVQI